MSVEGEDVDLTEDEERAMAAEFDRARGYDRPRSERAEEQRRLIRKFGVEFLLLDENGDPRRWPRLGDQP